MFWEKSATVRVLTAVTLSFIGLLTLTGPACAESPGIASQWQGMYYYPSGDKVAPVPFTMVLRVDGQAISGRTTEPATFGNGSSSQLFENISGTISGTSVSFTKTYDGTGGVSHSVQYRGTISPDGRSMSGTWNVGATSGSFSATATSQVSCLIPSKVFPKDPSGAYVVWNFGNSCGETRPVTVCADYGNGHHNTLSQSVPRSGADVFLLPGWVNLTWAEGWTIRCPDTGP